MSEKITSVEAHEQIDLSPNWEEIDRFIRETTLCPDCHELMVGGETMSNYFKDLEVLGERHE